RGPHRAPARPYPCRRGRPGSPVGNGGRATAHRWVHLAYPRPYRLLLTTLDRACKPHPPTRTTSRGRPRFAAGRATRDGSAVDVTAAVNGPAAGGPTPPSANG